MRSLADEQIDFIAEDIRRRGVFSASLQEDLLDHICCYIEEQPDDERPFAEIYRQALKAFGHNGLQAVQDETLYLINQPYLTKMKKFAYITGGLSSLFIIGGALFKVQHWPGANVQIIAGTLLMALFFIPYFFYTQFTEQTEKKSRIIAGLGLTTALLLAAGTLFKIMHWPGTIVIIFGFILLFVVFLPLYIINGARNPLTRLSAVSNGLLFACIGGFMLLLSFQQPSKNITDSLAVIESNEKEMLAELQARFHTQETASPFRYTMTQFVSSCDMAINVINRDSLRPEVANGDVVAGEDLNLLNDYLRKAVNKLNTEMNMYNGWIPLSFKEISSTTLGSAKFQVLQLKNKAYINAALKPQMMR